jgi:ATP-dependent Clp protease ATP-binding subunit ClpC
MTSNIGSRQIKDFGQGVGFSTRAKQESASQHTKSVIQNALKRSFAPEFLNRLDDVVIFNSLTKEDIYKIIDIELRGLYKRVENLGYSVEISKDAKDYITEKGFDVNFGARPLKRAIQKYLEDPMAEVIIKTSVKEGEILKVDYNKEKDEIVITPTPGGKKLPKEKPKDKQEKKG